MENKTYQFFDQLTGETKSFDDFESAKQAMAVYKTEYLEYMNGLFAIAVLVKNADGSIFQTVADENGNPIIPPDFDEPKA